MTTTTLRQRADIPEAFKWNAPSLFATPADWQAAAAQLQNDIPAFSAFQGRLGESAAVLLAALKAADDLLTKIGQIFVYAGLTQAVNTADPQGAQMNGQAGALFGQINAAVSFIEPELLAIGQERLQSWMGVEPGLKDYAHYFDDLFRKQAHVRTAEVEELLGMLSTPFAGAGDTATVLVDGELPFANATGQNGEKIPVTQGTLQEILSGTDREARRTAWENHRDAHLSHKNTLASLLNTSIRQSVFSARARRYDSTLEASLFQNAIPVQVFHNLIDVFRRNLPTWQRYWRIRRRALGVEQLEPYDIWAPLTDKRPAVSFQQTVDWVCSALAPLGEDYVATIRRGCLEERWIDVYPSQGKSSAQFSSGWFGTHPFIFLNYDETLFSASTMAHELGHSMHSYLTWQHQPFIYSNYSLFVAEVASNFHQAMLRAYLLKNNPDPAFQINVIEEAMNNFHRYFFIMPTLARFELEMHERAERGEGLSAEIMNERMADLFIEGYGNEMHVDRQRVGITWATFGHLYQDYYVYQYATGISAANALSRRVLNGGKPAAQEYRKFLQSGSSLYPLDALKVAGVDLSTPGPVEEAFEVLSGLVDLLDRLVP